jgi:hypothetical protein
MSRQMLERYSHIRMLAKRDAMEGITLAAPAPPADKEESKPAEKTLLQ